MKKKYKIGIGIALALVFIVLLILRQQNIIGGKQLHKVEVAEVQLRTIVEQVSASGKIQPQKDIKVSPFISGEVVELMVREGDQVKAGQLLAKIDPKQYQLQYDRAKAALNSQKAAVAQARAALAQAKADFSRKDLDFKRNEKLFRKEVISAAEFETAKAQYTIAQSQVISAEETLKASQYQLSSSEATLSEARENLTRTAVFAPQDGTVSLLKVEKGERVQGASQFSAGTELMRIANLNSMEVHIEVNENDIVRVSLGDSCEIEVDAYLGRKFTGVVSEIATSASTSGLSADQITNFDVKVRLISDSYRQLLKGKPQGYSPFRPGMSASVDIATDTKYQVPSIEIAAVTTRSDSTGKYKRQYGEQSSVDAEEVKEYVFVYEGGKVNLQAVETGIQDNKYIEIISGAVEGNAVVVAPYTAISKKLRNHQKVEVKK